MNSSLLPVALSKFAGLPVTALSLEALEQAIKSDATGVLAINSSEVGRFCAYWCPFDDAGAVRHIHRVSKDFPLRTRLKRLCKGYPLVRLLMTGEVL